MKIDRIIQVGLVSAFSFSALVLTSCDGESGGDSVGTLSTRLKAGDVITIHGSGGPTMKIIDEENISFAVAEDILLADYDFDASGAKDVMDLYFNGMLNVQQAVIVLNQTIANPDSSLNGLVFSENPTGAQLVSFVNAVEYLGVAVNLEVDKDLNLFVQENFRLIMPKLGEGTVENIVSGAGIELVLSLSGKLVSVRADGAERVLNFTFEENAGVGGDPYEDDPYCGRDEDGNTFCF